MPQNITKMFSFEKTMFPFDPAVEGSIALTEEEDLEIDHSDEEDLDDRFVCLCCEPKPSTSGGESHTKTYGKWETVKDHYMRHHEIYFQTNQPIQRQFATAWSTQSGLKRIGRHVSKKEFYALRRAFKDKGDLGVKSWAKANPEPVKPATLKAERVLMFGKKAKNILKDKDLRQRVIDEWAFDMAKHFYPKIKKWKAGETPKKFDLDEHDMTTCLLYSSHWDQSEEDAPKMPQDITKMFSWEKTKFPFNPAMWFAYAVNKLSVKDLEKLLVSTGREAVCVHKCHHKDCIVPTHFFVAAQSTNVKTNACPSRVKKQEVVGDLCNMPDHQACRLYAFRERDQYDDMLFGRPTSIPDFRKSKYACGHDGCSKAFKSKRPRRIHWLQQHGLGNKDMRCQGPGQWEEDELEESEEE